MRIEKPNDRLAGLLIIGVAFLVYATTFGNGFTLDDHDVILNNPAWKGSILSLFSIIDTINDTQLLPLYRPVTYLSYMVEWHLHGFNPFFVRLLNVSLHAVNALLVFRLARTLFKENMYAALLTALLFAVHPLHTEGVDFNAGARNTLLACFFSLSSYLVHLAGIIKNRPYYILIGSTLLLAGLFSKETALMVLPFILWLEIVNRKGNSTRQIASICLRLVPYCIAVSVYLVMRWLTLSKYGIQTSIIPGAGTTLLESMYVVDPLWTRLQNNIYIIPRYLLTVLWPTALSPRYEIPADLNLLALPLFCGWVAILAGLFWLLRRGRSYESLFGLAWLILFWLPVSGIVIIPIPLADRYLYLPAIGLWIMLSDQICNALAGSSTRQKRYAGATLLLILIILAGLTVRRNLDWKSNISLYTRFVDQYPDSVHAQAGLGTAYYFAPPPDRNHTIAETQFRKSLEMDPNAPRVHTMLGAIMLNKGDLNAALYHYDRAIEILPNDKEAHLNRGITLEKLGRPKEALDDFMFFLTAPGNTNNLGGGRQYAQQRVKALSE